MCARVDLVEQVHDLRLDRRRRAPSSARRATAATARSSGPSRSSRAGACRRRTRAGSARAAARQPGCAPPTAVRTASAFACGSARAVGGRGRPSVSCVPIFSAGFSDDIGSWKTIASVVAEQLVAARCRRSVARFVPLQLDRARDAAGVRDQLRDRERRHRLAAARTRRRSPTTSPAGTENETPLTTSIGPSGPGKVTTRS